METHEQAVKRGKSSKAVGRRFELKVRKDLESKGWIVSKWMNNVEFVNAVYTKESFVCSDSKMIPAKHKFRGPGIPMAIGTGFPDFIAFKTARGYMSKFYDVIGVEAKSKGYLTKEEKAKCNYYLGNNIFSKILIASKGLKRGEIKYSEFKND